LLEADIVLEQKVLAQLQEYVDHYQERVMRYACFLLADIANVCLSDDEWEKYVLENRQPPFNRVLFKLIDEKGAANADIYQRVGIGWRHFSKIRSNPRCRPGKKTVIALAMSLERNKEQADRLLSAAGYSLSESETFDLVIQFCLERGIYDMNDINQALDYFGLEPL